MMRAFRHAALPGDEREAMPVLQAAVMEFHFERAFTIAEVAEKLGLSPRQVQAHVDDGNLIAVNVGRGKERRDLRVLDEDLEGFARRRKTGAVPSVPTSVGNDPPPPLTTAPKSYAARREERLAKRKR